MIFTILKEASVMDSDFVSVLSFLVVLTVDFSSDFHLQPGLAD